ncbi:hypothetical protein AVEN_81620-1 [Araneus ventricosus]|uniref:Uncharacterized protein n=1 Tax=Araneus ventricosus TaxID=182803 RepID=A0A4Y2VEI3_ARAVE|nr:hypothetical protein AVEN_106144-1 [Araneus ventricosus]GBO22516.1 hypothetical protein AVEN_81620-1 [Araneus ventricosus]
MVMAGEVDMIVGGHSVMPRLVRKEKHPGKKKDKNKERLKNKFKKLDGKPGSRKQNFSKDEQIAESKAKKKNQFPKKNFNKKQGDWRKKHGSWKEKLKFGSQKNENKVSKTKKPKGGKYMSYNEKKPFKKQGKSSKFKGYKSKDTSDDYNRLFKKSINNSSPEGITYFPAETTGPKVPELPTARSMTVKRSDEVKRQSKV